ncbi:hypothetical protein LTR62_007407 [Meristemomyces frigidus]|uniref:Transmembrane protein n=1 Tax=Meristemomyces frigidus TaxID=1508187 RepID=A0AAN7YIX6_9PEZI|nr:hypothetical protein LTR62_007407 [Meristemomyces frigidus]
MGGRLSKPRGPGGLEEVTTSPVANRPAARKRPFPRTINSRTIVAPAAALTMACILFVYTRTSIRAAKANAQRHRNADSGGEGLSLLEENRRRHGTAARVDRGGSTVAEIGSAVRDQLVGGKPGQESAARDSSRSARSEEEERLRAMKGKARRRGDSEKG